MGRRAASYLWEAQDADGGWRSEVHGLARSGQSWTAFTLFHLLSLPGDIHPLPASRARRALAFIEVHTDTSFGAGAALGLADSLGIDYPVYATAHALRAYLLGRERGLLTRQQERLIPRMAIYLLDQQHAESQGVDPDDPAYGGWGIGTRPAAAGPRAGRSAPPYADVAHTRRVLQALAEVTRMDSSFQVRTFTAFQAARVFLARVQKRGRPAYDGGFFYSPVVVELNKAGVVDTVLTGGPADPLSYATATCDGLLALLAVGEPETSEPVRSATTYLAAHDTLGTAAGFPERRAAWREVLFFYHLAGRAEVNARLESPGPWRNEVVTLLRRRQRPDGSFLNPFGAPNKEDDSILATALALGALSSSS